MYNFNFYNPTRILFGKDQVKHLTTLVPANARVLITFGGGSAVRSGLMDRVKTELGTRAVFEFGGIEPNPRYETILKAAEVVRKENIDFILAVGGGSVIDGTKFLALAAHHQGNPAELLKGSHIRAEEVGRVIPFGTVLTLPATGSEMNAGSVISYNHAKCFFFSELVFPRFSILDPVLTYTLPAIQVANGIVDAFVHTTEQYITYPVDARLQDRWAEGLLHTLIEIGATAIHQPENYDARANLVWSATMALNGIIGAGVPQDWTTHMIGHELTALYGIDHGQTLAIIYPAVLAVCREQKKAKLLQYAERVWNITAGTDEEKIHLAIAKTKEFFRSLGIKTQLSEYGINSDQIPVIVDQLKAHGLTALSETRGITPEISSRIIEAAM